MLLTRSLEPAAFATYQTFTKIMSWGDEARRLGVRANADQPDQSANARAFGAERYRTLPDRTYVLWG